jgi:hypothetical protein
MVGFDPLRVKDVQGRHTPVASVATAIWRAAAVQPVRLILTLGRIPLLTEQWHTGKVSYDLRMDN